MKLAARRAGGRREGRRGGPAPRRLRLLLRIVLLMWTVLASTCSTPTHSCTSDMARRAHARVSMHFRAGWGDPRTRTG